MRIRFHLDENIPLDVAIGLRRRGIDVTTTAEARLAGAADEIQLAFAASEGRVLVTQDHDFLKLHADGNTHAGIAYAPRRSRTLRDLLYSLSLIPRTVFTGGNDESSGVSLGEAH